MDSVCENDLTVKLEILHLGWIIYAIVIWGVHKYYYFKQEDPQWPGQEELPPTDDLLWGLLIRKCWNGEYVNVDAMKAEAQALRTGSEDGCRSRDAVLETADFDAGQINLKGAVISQA